MPAPQRPTTPLPDCCTSCRAQVTYYEVAVATWEAAHRNYRRHRRTNAVIIKCGLPAVALYLVFAAGAYATTGSLQTTATLLAASLLLATTWVIGLRHPPRKPHLAAVVPRTCGDTLPHNEDPQ